jgi:hypothetical protein
MAPGGNELPLPHRPQSPAAVFREINRIAAAENLWTEVPGFLHRLGQEPGRGPELVTVSGRDFLPGGPRRDVFTGMDGMSARPPRHMVQKSG